MKLTASYRKKNTLLKFGLVLRAHFKSVQRILSGSVIKIVNAPKKITFMISRKVLLMLAFVSSFIVFLSIIGVYYVAPKKYQ